MLAGLGIHFVPDVTAGSVTIMLMLLGGAAIWWIRGAPDRRRAQTEADASLRTDLLDEVRKLRAEVTEERIRCDEKLAEQDKVISELQGLVKGLERQLLQLQISSGHPISLHATPETDKARERLRNIIGPIPGSEGSK